MIGLCVRGDRIRTAQLMWKMPARICGSPAVTKEACWSLFLMVKCNTYKTYQLIIAAPPKKITAARIIIIASWRRVYWPPRARALYKYNNSRWGAWHRDRQWSAECVYNYLCCVVAHQRQRAPLSLGLKYSVRVSGHFWRWHSCICTSSASTTWWRYNVKRTRDVDRARGLLITFTI